ncbi:MAG: hypothetical protein QM767_07510 [Anaeromyxobacter sp.]
MSATASTPPKPWRAASLARARHALTTTSGSKVPPGRKNWRAGISSSVPRACSAATSTPAARSACSTGAPGAWSHSARSPRARAVASTRAAAASASSAVSYRWQAWSWMRTSVASVRRGPVEGEVVMWSELGSGLRAGRVRGAGGRL